MLYLISVPGKKRLEEQEGFKVSKNRCDAYFVNFVINRPPSGKLFSAPLNGGAWESSFFLQRIEAGWRPHFDEDSKPVSRSASSSSPSMIPSIINMWLNTIKLESRIEILLRILSLLLIPLMFFVYYFLLA